MAELFVARRVAALIDELDWSQTPVGARASWPAALRYSVAHCIASGFPTLIWWGPEAIQIYNDAFVPILGKRHPAALGQRGEDCWPEIWGDVTAIAAMVRASGEPFAAQDRRFELERNGYVEETYFTFSYSRIDDDDGGSGGILVTTTETTQSVLREREFRQLGDSIAGIVFTHSASGEVEWANKRWYDYSRLPPELALRVEGWRRVVPPDDLDALLTTMSNAFEAGDAYEFETRIRPDGADETAYRWFHTRAEPIRAEDGSVKRWVGSAIDVHDKRMAADVLQAKFDLEYRASQAFQNAALPQRLPDVPGLQFSAVYEPGGAEALVGGDWYDAFALSDGRVMLSVGDVMGSGLNAAITMAGVRQSIRGAAQILPDPTAILDATDRALHSENPDAIVTAFVAVLDLPARTITFASAGHPTPFVAEVDGTVHELRAPDLPLGLRSTLRVKAGINGRRALSTGSLLVLYTDGLTEATRDALEGERRLRDVLVEEARFRSPSPASALRNAMPASIDDDVAVLTVRILGSA